MHTAAITRKSIRRKLDRYFTPTHAVDCLYDRVPITGKILEPCAGAGAISNHLKTYGLEVVATDIERNPADDATRADYWLKHMGCFDWIVTNPPFNQAAKIVPLAYEHSIKGIAFLLRLSYLEPCADRSDFLSAYPPNYLIVMPRISFTGNSKVDSCTTAWFVWDKTSYGQNIVIVPKN